MMTIPPMKQLQSVIRIDVLLVHKRIMFCKVYLIAGEFKRQKADSQKI
jgi:hypothetical protein